MQNNTGASTSSNAAGRSLAAPGITSVALCVALLQSGALGMFVVAGTVPVWLAVSFAIVSVVAMSAFLLYVSGKDDRAARETGLTPFLLAVATLVQLAFLFLAPKMSFVFLLGLLAIYAPAVVRLTPMQAQWAWMCYGGASGIAIAAAHDRFGFPGTSPSELALFWLAFFLALRAVITSASDLHAAREALSKNMEEVQALNVRLEQLVRHDALTGALNRRGLTEMLESELLRSQRTGHPFCFAVIDLDHFRQVNEKYGHRAGDMALKRLTDVSVRLLRALDRFGRLDSEEFGIVLPATWLDQGSIAMTRLTRAVTDHDWNQVAPGLKITFSGGLTTNAPGDTAEAIILRAEKALQQAKEQGRNRVVQIEEDLPPMPAVDLD